MRVTLMHNPKAGDTQPSPDELLDVLRDAGYDPAYQSVKEDDYAKALEDPGELVVIAGGDGTVGKVAKRMAGRDVPLGLLPLGTANNVARTLGIRGPTREIVAGWREGRRVAFDLGRACGPWGETTFIEAVGFGLFTGAMHFADYGPKEVVEKLAVTGDALQRDVHVLQVTLNGLSARLRRIELDGQAYEGRFLLLEAMNTNRIGPNLLLSENGDPGDGLLDVVLIPEDERERVERYLVRSLDDALEHPPFPVRQVQHVRIHWEASGTHDEVHIDDEIWPDPEGPRSGRPDAAVIDIHVLPRALTFLVG